MTTNVTVTFTQDEASLVAGALEKVVRASEKMVGLSDAYINSRTIGENVKDRWRTKRVRYESNLNRAQSALDKVRERA